MEAKPLGSAAQSGSATRRRIGDSSPRRRPLRQEHEMSVAAVNERLAAITAAGTSIWLDQLRRSMTLSGELGRMIEEESLRGVTSNPAIFEKAILGSSDYDEQLKELAEQGRKPREIYEEIAIRDVQLACDVLRSVWD